MNKDDAVVWPDGTTCTGEELPEMSHMSDDYRVVKKSVVKQVIVLRTDLNMRKGKMAAQAAHASMKVLLDRGDIYSDDARCFEVELWPEAVEWLSGLFTKVVVGVDSEKGLASLYTQAHAARLPVAMIIDSGATEFHGVKTPTAIAIGPAKSEDIDKITGDLKLL